MLAYLNTQAETLLCNATVRVKYENYYYFLNKN